MTQTTFTDNVLVDGSQDIQQLRVQGNTTQNQPLQTWENNAAVVQAQVTGDGRVEIGDFNLTTPDSMLEVHRADTSASKPKRGIHSLGQVTGTLSALLQWIVGELELTGASAISALHTALRIRASNKSTAAASAGAELRGADIEVINDTLANVAAFPKVTGLQVGVTNTSGKTITDAIGLKVKMTNPVDGTITNPFSIYTEGVGAVHLEDFVEVKRPGTTPGTPATDFVRVYPKPDGKLYTKNWNGIETELGGQVSAAPVPWFCARLTPVTGVPTPTADATAVTQVFLTPFDGNLVAAFDGVATQNFILPSDISIKLTDTQVGATVNASTSITGLTDTSQLIVGMQVTGTGIPANTTIASIVNSTSITLNNAATASGSPSLTFKVAPSTMLDLFVYPNSGVLKLEMVAWTNVTTRAVALIRQDGYLVKTGAPTRRYCGSVLTTTVAGQTERSTGIDNAGGTTGTKGGKCFIVNYYNTREYNVQFFDLTTHNYVTAAWRNFLNSTASRLEWISCFGDRDASAYAFGHFSGSAASQIAAILNNVTTPSGITDLRTLVSSTLAFSVGTSRGIRPRIGYNFLQAAEYGGASNVMTQSYIGTVIPA